MFCLVFIVGLFCCVLLDGLFWVCLIFFGVSYYLFGFGLMRCPLDSSCWLCAFVNPVCTCLFYYFVDLIEL